MRNFRPLVVVAMVAVMGAGCSSAPAHTGTAASTSGGTNATTARDKALKFAACMRDNGVSAFPDPDASGELTIDEVANHAKLDTSTAAFKQAMGACKDLEPSGFTGHTRSTQQQKNALAFAQCIRDNGVKDFPDPERGAPLVDTNRIPSAATSDGMTILNAAMQKCGDAARSAMGGRR